MSHKSSWDFTAFPQTFLPFLPPCARTLCKIFLINAGRKHDFPIQVLVVKDFVERVGEKKSFFSSFSMSNGVIVTWGIFSVLGFKIHRE